MSKETQSPCASTTTVCVDSCATATDLVTEAESRLEGLESRLLELQDELTATMTVLGEARARVSRAEAERLDAERLRVSATSALDQVIAELGRVLQVSIDARGDSGDAVEIETAARPATADAATPTERPIDTAEPPLAEETPVENAVIEETSTGDTPTETTLTEDSAGDPDALEANDDNPPTDIDPTARVESKVSSHDAALEEDESIAEEPIGEGVVDQTPPIEVPAAEPVLDFDELDSFTVRRSGGGQETTATKSADQETAELLASRQAEAE